MKRSDFLKLLLLPLAAPFVKNEKQNIKRTPAGGYFVAPHFVPEVIMAYKYQPYYMFSSKIKITEELAKTL